jgi:hypothetical protein
MSKVSLFSSMIRFLFFDVLSQHTSPKLCRVVRRHRSAIRSLCWDRWVWDRRHSRQLHILNDNRIRPLTRCLCCLYISLIIHAYVIVCLLVNLFEHLLLCVLNVFAQVSLPCSFIHSSIVAVGLSVGSCGNLCKC